MGVSGISPASYGIPLPAVRVALLPIGLVLPGVRRGQHWIQRVRTERISDDAYRILSYWSSTRWEAGSPAPVMGALGLYTDTVVRRDGRWMIQEKVIDRWETTGIDVRQLRSRALFDTVVRLHAPFVRETAGWPNRAALHRACPFE